MFALTPIPACHPQLGTRACPPPCVVLWLEGLAALHAVAEAECAAAAVGSSCFHWPPLTALNYWVATDTLGPRCYDTPGLLEDLGFCDAMHVTLLERLLQHNAAAAQHAEHVLV